MEIVLLGGHPAVDGNVVDVRDGAKWVCIDVVRAKKPRLIRNIYEIDRTTLSARYNADQLPWCWCDDCKGKKY